MNSAIKKAQETFPEFVKELEMESRRVVPALDAAIVKAFFFEPTTPEKGEHMFVNHVRVEGDLVHGILSSTPHSVAGLREGEEVSFPISRVSDWFVVIEGRGKGGHTLDVIAKRMPKAAYAQASKHPPSPGSPGERSLGGSSDEKTGSPSLLFWRPGRATAFAVTAMCRQRRPLSPENAPRRRRPA